MPRLASHSLATGDFCSSNASSRHPQASSEIKHLKLDKHQSTMQVEVGGELPFCGAKLVELLGRKYSEKVRTTCALQPRYNHRKLLQ